MSVTYAYRIEPAKPKEQVMKQTNGRHVFRPAADRPIVCEDCRLTRGSVNHSVLGSNKHMVQKQGRTR